MISDNKRSIDNISSGNAAGDQQDSVIPNKRKYTSSATMANEVIRKVQSAFLSNRFDALATDEPSTSTAISVPTQQVRPIKLKIPPIVIQNQKFANVVKILTSLKIKDYTTNLMSIGIKVTLNDIQSYDQVLSFLDVNKEKYRYYTFDVQHRTPVKIVLYKLPLLDIDTVKEEINAIGTPLKLICEEVRLINTKTTKYDEYALYVVSFKRENFNMNILKSITGLFHVRVSWSMYKRRGGPMQCTSCQQFGHGNRNCHLQTKCSLCGEQHNATDCIHLNQYEEGIYVSIKCCNCNGNHPSTSPICPKRNDFIKMRQNLSRKANNNKQRRKNSNHKLDYDNSQHYPQLRPTRSAQHSHQQQYTHTGPPQQNNPHLAQQSSTLRSPPLHTSRAPWFNSPQSPQAPTTTTSTDELFTPGELLQLSQEMLSSLRGCKNKFEQFQIITELSIKYLYGYK